jgi:hypothetical protein
MKYTVKVIDTHTQKITLNFTRYKESEVIMAIRNELKDQVEKEILITVEPRR